MYNGSNGIVEGDNMINLVKTNNLNLAILETDFDVFADIANSFSDIGLKKECLIDLDDYAIPEYFKDKMTLVVQSNDMLLGYAIINFNNKNNSITVNIDKLDVFDEFKNKNMEAFLVEGIIYIAGEVGARNATVEINEQDVMYMIYSQMGFRKFDVTSNGVVLSANVATTVELRKLNDKFRDVPSDYVDYKSLKLTNKISEGRTGTIYLTSDNQILKMFKTTSFTYIKDREETLKALLNIDVEEVVKPKNLVYYNGVFVGYTMDYLPDGKSLYDIEKEKCSFEEKIDRIKKIEEVMQKLHNKKIYICDLNAENIFFDKDDNVKLIDCDAFVIKKNVINTNVDDKFVDPFNKIVSENSDLYAFAITILELLLNIRFKKEDKYQDIRKIYEKNKSKLPVSFKSYFDSVFNGKQRQYLSEGYEKYVNEMYSVEKEVTKQDIEQKGGNVSVIILSLIALAIAIIGFIALKYGR